jgi:hypothetical protein
MTVPEATNGELLDGVARRYPKSFACRYLEFNMPARFTAAAFLMLCTVTFGAVPTVNDVGSIRADSLKANVTGFRLSLSYVGESGKPYYSLLLSVPELNLKKISPFSLQARISKDQTLKVIDHLTKVGSLDRAHKTGELEKLPQPSYLLSVRAGDLYFSEILGWDLDMLKRLDGLRSVLDGDAVKSMDTLLGRLYGHRREWMAAVPDKRSAEDAITVTGLRALDKGGVSVESGLRAVGRPAQVQARVLDGSGHNQKIGDMEIWISQAVAKKGSSLAKPYTGWITLTGDDQRLYRPGVSQKRSPVGRVLVDNILF